jgi:hypothetical protein
MDFYTWLTEEAESNNNLGDSDINSSMIIHISQFNTHRSAVSSLFRIIFGFSPADSYQAKLLAKAFNKSHPKHPRFEDAWDYLYFYLILTSKNLRRFRTGQF